MNQKENLELRLLDASRDSPTAKPENVLVEKTKERINTFREALKTDIADTLENSPDMNPKELKELTNRMIVMNLEKAGSNDIDQTHTRDLGRELGENIAKRKPHEVVRYAVINSPEMSRIR